MTTFENRIAAFNKIYSKYVGGLLDKELGERTLWVKTDVYERIKDLEIIYAKQIIHPISLLIPYYDEYFCEAADGRYFYVRYSSGIFYMSESERFIMLPHQGFNLIGVLAPPADGDILESKSLQEIAALFGWKIKDGAMETFS